MAVQDKDLGWSAMAKKLKELSAANDAHVLVGVQSPEGDQGHGDDGLTNLQLAQIHEFGVAPFTGRGRSPLTGETFDYPHPGIPARSFIRAAIDEHEGTLAETAAVLGRYVALGRYGAGQALQLLGEKTVGIMIDRINAHIAPPNAPSTIARKGSSTPLIAHTGQLKKSITYKLSGGGGGGAT